MTISILGCGWLGFPAGLHLVSRGYQVKGSTTTDEKLHKLKKSGINPFLIRISDQIESDSDSSFWDTDILFLNIPPGRANENFEKRHLLQIQAIIEKISQHNISWVIYASSTSVYPKFGGITTEDDAVSETASSLSGKTLLACEQLLNENDDFDTTVIRFGGLYGYDRHPVRYLAGRENISEGNKPINLIHQDDCIRILARVIEKDARNQVFNAVSDGHPPRKEFYQSAASHFGLDIPHFKEDESSGYRIVSNEKIKTLLNYRFLYPNPMDHTP
jgi:nucleoside-diphosphate-sugar epimerase